MNNAEKSKSPVNRPLNSGMPPQFLKMMEIAYEGVLIIDTQNQVTFVNRRMCELLGYTGQEMLHRKVTDFMFEEDIPDHSRRMETRRKLQSEQYDRRFRHKNGRELWMVVSAKPMADENGQFVGAYGHFTDVTEQKDRNRLIDLLFDYQFKLSRAETIDQVCHLISQKIHEVIKEGIVGTSLVDEKQEYARITSVHGINQVYFDLVKRFNSNPESTLYPIKNASPYQMDIFKAETLKEFKGGLYQLFIKKYPKKICQIVEKQLHVNHIMVMGMVYEDKRLGGVGIFTEEDISRYSETIEIIVNQAAQVIKRLSSEKKKQISEDRLQKTLAAIEEGYWDWDISSGDFVVNDQWYTMLGYNPNEFPANFDNFCKLIHQDDLETAIHQIEAAKTNRNINYNAEFRMRIKSGEYKYILARGKVITTSDNNTPVRMVGIQSDFSEHKKSEQDQTLFYETQKKILQVSNLEDLYQLVGKSLVKLLGNGYVVFTRFDQVTQLIRVAGFYGFGKLLDEIKKRFRLSTSSFDVRVEDIDKENMKLWESNSLVQYTDGLYGLLTRKVPKSVCQAIEKQLLIKQIYVMGCQWNDRDYGGFVLLAKGPLERNKELIKTLINETAIAIQRIITEEEVHVAQTRYRNIFEESPVGIATAGSDFKFLTANAEFSRMFGYNQDELVEMTFKNIIYPDYFKQDVEQISKLVSGEANVYSTVKRYIRKDGQPLWGKLVVNKICDSQGRFLYLLVMVTDITKEMISEEAMRENQRFLEIVLDTIPNMVFVRDNEGRYRLVNRAFAEAMGKTRKEFIGKTDKELRFSFDFENISHQQDINVLNSGNDLLNPDVEIVFPGKGPKQVQMVKRSLPDAEHKLPAVLGVITDISDRKKAEEALQKSEEKHRLLIENSHDIIYTLAKNGEVTFVSNAWILLLGYPASEVIGKPFIQNMHTDDRKRFKKFVHNIIFSTTRKSGVEYRIKHADGSWRWHTTSAVPLFDEKGNCVGIEGTARDITEQKRAEAALQESEERYRMLVENSPVGIMLAQKGKFIYANAAGLMLFGCQSLNELVGQKVMPFIHPQSRQDLLKRIFEIRRGKSNSLMDIKIIRKNGEICETESTSSLVKINGVQTVLIFGQDISIRREAEEKIRRNTEDLTLINKLNESVNRGDTLDDNMALLHEESKKIFPSNSAAIYLINPENNSLELQSLQINPDIRSWLEGALKIKIPNVKIKLTPQSIYKRILENNKIKYIEEKSEIMALMGEFTDNPAYKKLIPVILKRLSIHAVIDIPLIVNNESVGLLEFSSKAPFTTEDMQRLEFISFELSSIIRRKQAEEALKISEEKFRQIVERSNDIFLRQNFNTLELEYISPKVFDLLGYDQSDVLDLSSKEIDKLIHPEDEPEFDDIRGDVLKAWQKGEKSLVIDFRLRSKQGGYKWLAGNYSLVTNDEKEPALIISTLSDITERKLNEQTLSFRVKLMQLAPRLSINELLVNILDEVEKITDSSIGFYHFVDQDQKTITMKAWSTNTITKTNGAMAEGMSVPNPEKGIWHECLQKRQALILNDPGAFANLEGHANEFTNITRQLIVPVMRNEKIVSIIGVGNKPSNYTTDDLEMVSKLADLAWDIIENKNIEAALQESEAIFNAFMENSPIYVFFKDKDIRSKQLSRNYEKLLGKPLDQLLGKNMDEIFPSEVSKAMIRDDQKILNEGKTLVVDEEMYGRFYTTIKFPIYKDNEPQYLAGFTIDITDRVLSEKKLAESEEMYRLISSVVSDYLFSSVIDANDHLELQWVAGAFESITGYSLPEYKQNGGWRASIYPDDLPIDDRDLHELHENKKVITEIRTIKKDGSICWVRVYSQPIWDDAHNRLAGINGAVQDITERKKAEEEIRKSAIEFEVLYETAKDFSMHNEPDIIFNTIADRACSLFNALEAYVYLYDPETEELELKFSKTGILPLGIRIKQGEGISGLAAQRLTPMIVEDYDSWTGRLPDLEGSNFAAAMCAPMMYGGQLIGVLGVLEKHPSDQKFTEEDAHFLSLFASQAAGAIYGAILVEKLRDNAAELELRVNDRTKELQAKNKELETFTYTVSHDLKAPLRGISGYSTLLMEDHADQLNEEGKRYLKNLVNSTERMNMLIEDLLTYSRIERHQIKKTTVNLDELIDRIIDEYQPEIARRNLQFAKELEYDTLFTDHEALSQALRNIIDNAVKFSREQKNPCITIRCEKLEQSVLISVNDNGIGFEMKYYDKIFEIFQRLHLSEEYPGTGIGLAVVRKAVEGLGGKIWAVSEPGAGSTFFLELPL